MHIICLGVETLKLDARGLLGLKNSKRDDFEEAVKSSFLKVKEHMNVLEADVKAGKEVISAKNSEFSSVFSKLDVILVRLKELEDKMVSSGSSIGNEGVYSDIHSFTIHSCTQQKEQEKPVKEGLPAAESVRKPLDANNLVLARASVNQDSLESGQNSAFSTGNLLKELRPKMVKSSELAVISASRQELLVAFSLLSKQELRTFLTIYELSEEKGSNVSYMDVANRLKLSEGCIRTYISGLMRKKIPIDKVKYNNKTVFLQIPREFMDLSLKKELISMYYETVMPNQKRLGSF